MLTISLDEQGDFEGLKNENKPVFIAGVIYDDLDDEGDRKAEKERIKAYYKAVVQDALNNEKAEKEKERPGGGAAFDSSYGSDFVFPLALHSVGDWFKDNNVVRPVKQQVSQTLGEFFQKGTYRGCELFYKNSIGKKTSLKGRKGRYYLFAIIKSDRGMRHLLAPNASILAKDDYASNLYFHMADELLSRLLFHNPILGNVRDVSLDIATRASADMGKTDPIYREYVRLGYKNNDPDNGKDGKYYFNLTNGDVYRSVLADEIIRSGKTGIHIESFNVRSINYNVDGKGMEFLYLADSLCGILGFNIPCTGADDWLPEMVSRAKALVCPDVSCMKPGRGAVPEGSDHVDDLFIFGYDEIDLYYRKAYSSYEEGDYYSALNQLFDGKKQEGAFAEHYDRTWFRRLENDIAASTNEAALATAIHKLHDSIFSNRLEQDRSLYILGVIENAVERVKERFRTPEARRVIYEFYDAGISFYTHIGDSRRAALYYGKCTELVGLVGFEDYLTTRNRMSVCCCDSFDYGKAMEIAGENVTYQEMLSDMKMEVQIARIREKGVVSLGKAFSQKGQVLAFLRDAEAESFFRKALDQFDPASVDYKITQSFLLHFYLDREDGSRKEQDQAAPDNVELKDPDQNCGESSPKEEKIRNVDNLGAVQDPYGYKRQFLEEAEKYFGGNKTLSQQLKYIIEEGTGRDPLINIKYALYVYLRSIYRYRLSEVTSPLLEKLRSIEKEIAKKLKKEKWRLEGHPAELIFLYLSLIERSVGDPAVSREYEGRIDTCLGNKGPAEDVICSYGHARCADADGDIDRRDALSAELVRDMSEQFPALEAAKDMEEGHFSWLQEHVTFMYC